MNRKKKYEKTTNKNISFRFINAIDTRFRIVKHVYEQLLRGRENRRRHSVEYKYYCILYFLLKHKNHTSV